MRKFIASSHHATISGQILQAFYHTAAVENYLPVLQRYDLHAAHAAQWYPYQAVLDALKALTVEIKDSRLLISIGAEINRHAYMPNVNTIERALEELDTIHSMNHRDISPMEHIAAFSVGPRYAVVVNATPYPDDWIYGYLWGLMQRFINQQVSVTIRYDNLDHINSDDEMKYHVQWGPT